MPKGESGPPPYSNISSSEYSPMNGSSGKLFLPLTPTLAAVSIHQ